MAKIDIGGRAKDHDELLQSRDKLLKYLDWQDRKFEEHERLMRSLLDEMEQLRRQAGTGPTTTNTGPPPPPPPPPPPHEPDEWEIEVPNSINASVGHGVNYLNGTLQFSDSRFPARFCTHVVGSTSSGKVRLRANSDRLTYFKMATGRGTNATGIIYTYHSGTFTDEITDIRNNTTNRLVTGEKYVQQAGFGTNETFDDKRKGTLAISRPGMG